MKRLSWIIFVFLLLDLVLGRQPAPAGCNYDRYVQIYSAYRKLVATEIEKGARGCLPEVTAAYFRSLANIQLLKVKVVRVGKSGKTLFAWSRPNLKLIVMPKLLIRVAETARITENKNGDDYILIQSRQMQTGSFRDGIYVQIALREKRFCK